MTGGQKGRRTGGQQDSRTGGQQDKKARRKVHQVCPAGGGAASWQEEEPLQRERTQALGAHLAELTLSGISVERLINLDGIAIPCLLQNFLCQF